MTRAALLFGPGSLEIRELESTGLGPEEVRVSIKATGICGSDLRVYERGGLAREGQPSPIPLILGHEAAGVVAEVGAGVTTLQPGDHVILAVMPQCGRCRYCRGGQPTLCVQGVGWVGATGPNADGSPRFTLNGQPVKQFSDIGTWSETTVVFEAAAVKIDPAMPLPQSAILGCGVVTGYGAAANVAHVGPGDSVAILGCGGLGLSGVQAARIAGAERIIAIDLVELKLDLARSLGATDCVNGSKLDATRHIHSLTNGDGADITLDYVGTKDSVQQAIAMTRKGGQIVVTGLAGNEWTIQAADFLPKGKVLKGNLMGMGNFAEDFTKLVALYQAGQLELDLMVSRTIGLDDIADGFRAMQDGEVARTVITID